MADRESTSKPGPSYGTTDRQLADWNVEETYWRANWQNRPYAAADRGFEYYRPGYRYGFESAQRLRGNGWNDVERELRSGWDTYEFRSKNTWENVKDAVRDGFERLRNRY